MNIVFKKLKLQSFLSLGDIEISLNDNGFTLVKGVNNTADGVDSNGSGKSALFDGIVWILTGSTIRGSSDVVNSYTNGGTYGSIEMSIDGHEYIVTRTKSHSEFGNSLSLYIDGEDRSGGGLRKTEAILAEELPGLNAQLLGSVIVLGQGLPNRFSALSPAGRKDLLETLSKSSEFIDKLQSQLKSFTTDATDKLSEYNQRLSFLTGSISSLQSSNQSLNAMINSAQYGESIGKLDEYHQLITQLDTKLADIQNRVTEATSLTQEDDVIINRYKLSVRSLQDNINKLNGEVSQMKSMTGICPTCGRPFEHDDHLAEMIKSKTDSINSYQNSCNILNEKINTQTENKSYHSNMLRLANNDLYMTNERRSSILAEISKLETLQSTINQLKDQIVKNTQKISDDQIEVKSLNEQVSKLTNRLEILKLLSRESSKEFRSYLLEDVVYYLNNKVKQYSQYLFQNDCIEILRDGSKIFIGYEGRSYELLSSGEKQRVDLAVQFSLRDMLIDTTGFSCNILVLDESFDGLDSKGCQNLVKLITEKFIDLSSIYIITHHSDISVPYDSRIIIDKENPGISRISEVSLCD